jgi:4-hydroxybenzoate polyprenyltransferase
MSLAWVKPLIKTMRPRQWVKNGLLFIPIVFDKQLTNWPALARTIFGFILFCLLSSVIYIINDLVDLEADRKHPLKKMRPLASGALKISTARTAGIVLTIIIFIPATLLSLEFALIGLTYLVLNLAYSAWLKNAPILDVMILASFYVLRVAAGVSLITVTRFSPWLYVFTTFLALYLGIGKRRAELNLLAEEANSHRKSLGEYTLPLLDQLILIVSGSSIITYSLYTFSAPNLPANDEMMLTIPFVIYGIFRYLYLLQVKHCGGEPEEVLLTDRPLQATIVLWILSVLIIFYFIPLR